MYGEKGVKVGGGTDSPKRGRPRCDTPKREDDQRDWVVTKTETIGLSRSSRRVKGTIGKN